VDNPLNDEHRFPRGLGKFRGYKEPKEKICNDCNGRFGVELEDVFLHCGPTSSIADISTVGDDTIGERLVRDPEAFLPLPAVSYQPCEKQPARVSSLSLVRYRGNDYSLPTA
jgi:hypothetical protein